MLSLRQLLVVVGCIFAIAACERTITGPTVYVDRPHYDTTVVLVPRPETSFVQLPGRVDTVVTRRVDTLLVIRHDTTTITRTDTVTHWDTVLKRDTLTKHDTVYVHDTVLVHRGSAELPRLSVDTRMPVMPMNGDTLWGGGRCTGPYVARDPRCAQYVAGSGELPPGSLLMVGAPASALSSRAPRDALILPGWWARH